MNHREHWQPILDAEVRKWSAKPCAELIATLSHTQSYEIEFEGKKYQVEIVLLESTNRYVHLSVGVDDGSIPASFRPLSKRFVREK